VALAGLVVAVAQWRLARDQTKISKSLADLEFAKAAAKFEFEPSSDRVQFEMSDAWREISLPRRIKVIPISGVKSVRDINAPVWVTLEIAEVTTCTFEFRGLYVEDGKNQTSLYEPYLPLFRALLGAIIKQGPLHVRELEPTILVNYEDVMGRSHSQQFTVPKGVEVQGAADKTSSVDIFAPGRKFPQLYLQERQGCFAEQIKSAVAMVRNQR
jgi:hypothetical protein